MKSTVTINRYIGGILLVSGTTIGAGMLALPVLTGFVGLIPSLCIFLLCWSIMLATACFFLDVHLAVDHAIGKDIGGSSNLIAMSYAIFGRWGKGISWSLYLLLLYSLTTAYLSASSPLFLLAIRGLTGVSLSPTYGPFCLPLLFGFFIYLGTLQVDFLNRVCMLGLCISYCVLIGFLPSHIDTSVLTHVNWSPIWISVPVVITSFGYHIIIPSLAAYMERDRKALRRVLVLGSLIPLIFYGVWQVVILGTVPLCGKWGLIEAWKRGESAIFSLVELVIHPSITLAAHFFSFFAIVTSFLGVTLSLSDFLTDGLTDGLGIKKTGFGKSVGLLLTFIPPLLLTLLCQRSFFLALEYAGICVALLLIIFPSMMAWKLKYPKFYTRKTGKALLSCIILFGVAVILLDIWQRCEPDRHCIINQLQ